MTDVLINFDDYQKRARELLDPMIYGYYASGAQDEITLDRNQSAYQDIFLLPRVLNDVSVRSTETKVLGETISFPIMVAPMAFQGMAHSDGELATVRAAGAAGSIMILSTLSTTSMEDVVAAASGPVWFQLYVYKDRELTEGLVKRAEAAGCKALVLTVDAPLLGRREADIRNHFHLPAGMEAKNLLPAGMQRLDKAENDSGLASYVASLLDPGIAWKDIEWLRSITKLPVIVKGILHPDDALKARDYGASAIVVSNHGGRQVDTAQATIKALPKITEQLNDSIEVYVDGGVRRGTDVLKALACGARAVLLGRPILWGLAVNGQAGAEAVLQLLKADFDLAMALCGCRSVQEIQRDLIAE
ncbi:MAG: alpha-hydroxy acid oxidase [Planctomycetota bacterium]|nr:alpha-hydroxy acid oxidase [Planctomycetota bacterium]